MHFTIKLVIDFTMPMHEILFIENISKCICVFTFVFTPTNKHTYIEIDKGTHTHTYIHTHTSLKIITERLDLMCVCYKPDSDNIRGTDMDGMLSNTGWYGIACAYVLALQAARRQTLAGRASCIRL